MEIGDTYNLENEQVNKETVRLRLDRDVVNFFNNHADRDELINQILRDEMEAQKLTNT